MNVEQLKEIALLVGSALNRTMETTDIDLLQDAVGDLDYRLVDEAIRLLVRETTQYINYALIRQRATALSQQRLSEAVEPTPPPGLGEKAYREWLSAWRQAVIVGRANDAERLALEAVGVPASIAPTKRNLGDMEASLAKARVIGGARP